MRWDDFGHSAAFAAAWVAGATLLVHVFAPLPLGWIETATHIAVVCACYTLGYLLALGAASAAAPRLPGHWADATLVRVLAPSIVAVVIGGLLLRASAALSATSLYFDHGEEDWSLKLVAVWLALTAALYQHNRNRRLENALALVAGQAAAGLPISSSDPTTVDVDVGGRVLSLRSSEIVWVKAEENYCSVQCLAGAQSVLVRSTLTSLAKVLPRSFVRTHRSFLINISHVLSIERRGRAYVAAMRGGGEAPIARSRVEQFMEAWERGQQNDA